MNGKVFAPGQRPGFRIPEGKPMDWFCYPVRFTAVAEGDTDTLNVQIDAGSDFYLTAITQFSTVDGATSVLTVDSAVIPVATILLTDTGSNRQLMNAPVPLTLVAGDGNHPHRLIHPRLFVRNSNITVTINALDTAQNLTYSNIWVNLEGFRIYQ